MREGVLFRTMEIEVGGFESLPTLAFSATSGRVSRSLTGHGAVQVLLVPSVGRDCLAQVRTNTQALSHSNLNFTFIEGVKGGDGETEAPPSAGARGSWRSHRNALQDIVDRDLGSVLVLEDDVDWDVRLKSQMQTFARASRTWLGIWRRRRRQQDSNSEAGSRIPSSGSSASAALESEDGGASSSESDTVSLSLSLSSSLLSTAAGRGIPTLDESPYGDDWDVLWLGHCGADLPTAAPPPSLKIAIFDDATVPAPKHLVPHPFALRDELAGAFPPHTRVVHAARGNVCSLAYAVSRRGERKLLARSGRDGFVAQWDLMLRDYCMERRGYEGGGGEDGEAEEEEDEETVGNGGFVCLTVQPPLISHRYAGREGADGGGGGGSGASTSDIKGQGGGFARSKKGTPYVRLSVQENLRRLADGSSGGRLVDQLPDDGDTLW